MRGGRTKLTSSFLITYFDAPASSMARDDELTWHGTAHVGVRLHNRPTDTCTQRQSNHYPANLLGRRIVKIKQKQQHRANFSQNNFVVVEIYYFKKIFQCCHFSIIIKSNRDVKWRRYSSRLLDWPVCTSTGRRCGGPRLRAMNAPVRAQVECVVEVKWEIQIAARFIYLFDS